MAKVKGVGVDCVHLIMAAAEEAGMVFEKVPNYTEGDEYQLMIKTAEKYCKRVRKNSKWKYGDILIFRNPEAGINNHCGFYTDIGVIHAVRGRNTNMVVEHVLDELWLKSLDRVYRFK